MYIKPNVSQQMYLLVLRQIIIWNEAQDNMRCNLEYHFTVVIYLGQFSERYRTIQEKHQIYQLICTNFYSLRNLSSFSSLTLFT